MIRRLAATITARSKKKRLSPRSIVVAPAHRGPFARTYIICVSNYVNDCNNIRVRVAAITRLNTRIRFELHCVVV